MNCKVKKKNPFLAAALGFCLGPLGYLYIGWRYAIVGLGVFLMFILGAMVIDYPLPEGWIEWVPVVVMAWKAWTIVSGRNALIDDGDGQSVMLLGRWPSAVLAMSDLFVGMVMVHAGALAVFFGIGLIGEGRLLKGMLAILLGVPLMPWIFGMLANIITMPIDAIAAWAMERRRSD